MTAKVFIPLLIAILFAFGFFIAFVARRLGGKIAPLPFNVITGVLVATILLGIVGMFQPWNIELYRLGFKMVLVGTLAFTVWSHVTPRMIGAAQQDNTNTQGG